MTTENTARPYGTKPATATMPAPDQDEARGPSAAEAALGKGVAARGRLGLDGPGAGEMVA